MTQSLRQWVLVDCFHPESLRQSTDTIRLESLGVLTEQLRDHATQIPHEVFLRSPSGELLFVALGGPTAAATYYNPNESGAAYAAFAEQGVELQSKFFTSNGQPLEIARERLLPIEVVISIAGYFFLHGTLPANQRWAEA